MPGTIKMFFIRMNILSHRNNIVLSSWHATWPPCKTSIALPCPNSNGSQLFVYVTFHTTTLTSTRCILKIRGMKTITRKNYIFLHFLEVEPVIKSV